MGLHGLHQCAGAVIEGYALCDDLVDRCRIQSFHERHALTQSVGKVEFAAHGTGGNAGDLVAKPGKCAEFVDALLSDDGGIHVGHEQLLAAVAAGHYGNVDRGIADGAYDGISCLGRL